MEKLISKRYAIALFKLGKETGKIETFNSDIELIEKSIKDNKDFTDVINHPMVSSEEKINLLKNIYGDNISEEVKSFLDLIIHKNRENELLGICEVFLELFKEYKGITTAYVVSSKKLSEEQINKIKEKLSFKLNKEVIVKTDENSELIGGIVINVEGKIIDNSIKKGLQDIKKILINN